MHEEQTEIPEPEITRPTTRGDCRGAIRPCPWVACRHHLLLDVGRPKDGRYAPALQRARVRQLRGNASAATADAWTDAAADDLLEMPDTCALDVAERDVVEADARVVESRARVATLARIGAVLGITREGARLEVIKAVDAARRNGGPDLEPFTRDRVRLTVLADGCRRR